MRDLCFVDLETTGLDSSVHEIIEVAIIRTTPSLEVKEEFHALVIPENLEKASPKALEINHYSHAKWESEAISLSEAMKKTSLLTEGCIFAGHNTPFDEKFLRAAFLKVDLKPNWDYHSFDTSQIAVLFQMQKRVRSVSLGKLLTVFGIKVDKQLHSAKNDIQYTLQLAREMLRCLHIVEGPPRIKATLVAIEGIDGTGKSLLIKGLLKKLLKYGLMVESTEEPTRNSQYGIQLRSNQERFSPEQELMFFMEDRKIHRSFLEILRNTKDIVILDRYYPSSMSYQGVRIAQEKNVSLEEIMLEIRDRNERLVPEPDLVLILDVDPEQAIQRLLKRQKKEDAFENIDNLRQVRKAFQCIRENKMLSCPVRVLDTNVLSPEETLEISFQEIKKVYFS